MRVGVLTGGDDCPGLNAVIRALVRTGELHYGDELIGLRDGWRGAMEGEIMVLSAEVCRCILPLGGTILGTTSTNPYAFVGGPARVVATLDLFGIEALVAVGVGDTLGVANRLGGERSSRRSALGRGLGRSIPALRQPGLYLIAPDDWPALRADTLDQTAKPLHPRRAPSPEVPVSSLSATGAIGASEHGRLELDLVETVLHHVADADDT